MKILDIEYYSSLAGEVWAWVRWPLAAVVCSGSLGFVLGLASNFC
jgi:hypothetical protein